MAISEQVLEHYRQQWKALTGNQPNGFICPISHEDITPDRCCDGHILNEAIKSADRTTVPQYEQFDSFFGGKIENELIRWLNMPATTPEEFVANAKTLTITMSSGQQAETFNATKAARAKFPEIEFYRPDGSVFHRRYARAESLPSGKQSQMPVKWRIEFNVPSIVGSWMKAAYLALFKIGGYAMLRTASVDRVRRSLLEFTESDGSRKSASKIFCSYEGSDKFIWNGDEFQIDTVKQNQFLLHFDTDDVNGEIFAQTLFFPVNGRLHTVTIPANRLDRNYFVQFEKYKRFVKDRRLDHFPRLARLHNDVIEVSSGRFPIKLAESIEDLPSELRTRQIRK